MSVLAMTLPIPEGKLKALENHIAEAKHINAKHINAKRSTAWQSKA